VAALRGYSKHHIHFAFKIHLKLPGEHGEAQGNCLECQAYYQPYCGLWKRIPAGLWLITAGCYLPVGMLIQRAFMIYVGHFPDQDNVRQTILGSLPYSSVLIALGSFAVVTGLLKWPKLL
jgi:hypothetical protein